MGKLGAGAIQSTQITRWGLSFSGVTQAEDLSMNLGGREYELTASELPLEIANFCVRVPGRFDEFILNLKKVPENFVSLEFFISSPSNGPFGWTLQSQVSIDSWSSDRINASSGNKVMVLRLVRNDGEWDIESHNQAVGYTTTGQTVSSSQEIRTSQQQINDSLEYAEEFAASHPSGNTTSQVWLVVDTGVSMERLLVTGTGYPVAQAISAINSKISRRPLKMLLGTFNSDLNREIAEQLRAEDFDEFFQQHQTGRGFRSELREFLSDTAQGNSTVFLLTDSVPPITQDLLSRLENLNIKVQILLVGDDLFVPELPSSQYVSLRELGSLSGQASVEEIIHKIS